MISKFSTRTIINIFIITLALVIAGALITPNLFIEQKTADAQFVFGGPLFYFPCTCSAGLVYYVVVGPPSMGYFSYTIGLQGYANYNMPFARYALGLYTPGTGACWMGVTPYCFVMPTTGFMTYTVGSSL